jgi:hypothetical protein
MQRNFRFASSSLSENFITNATQKGWDKMLFVTVYDHKDWKDNVKTGESDEGQESVVVIYPNTIVDPGAVVVVALNTNIANGTVARPRSSNNFTIWAKIGWAEFL